MTLWKLKPNASKTAILCFPPRPNSDLSVLSPSPFTFPDDRTCLSIVDQHKHLGIILDQHLSFDPHITYLEKRASSIVGFLSSHLSHFPRDCRLMLYKCYVLPVFDYCSSIWAGISTSLTNRLEVAHRRLIRTVFAIPRLTPSHTVYAIASSCPLSNRLRLSSCKLIHKIRLGLAPPHVLSQLNWFHQSSATRNSLCFPISRTATLLKSPLFLA